MRTPRAGLNAFRLGFNSTKMDLSNPKLSKAVFYVIDSSFIALDANLSLSLT
jgi:hypothetical protein